MAATADLVFPQNAPPPVPRGRSPNPGLIDQRVRLSGITWGDYQRLLDLRGESAVPRLTYLNGELELMSPSVDHEGQKTRLGRLIEFYAGLSGIAVEGFGSWTLHSEQQKRGAEADECYLLGPLTGPPTLPDFAIEVIWTHGGIDKLEVYRGLGVPEVWVWQDGRLRFYSLEDAGYRATVRSRFLPALDPHLIEECMAAPSQTEALAVLRARLGA
ncbi:MAG TPA: Uma2 family endonuclease [Lamprocystis sp. (in: g-proteobacteria)]|nr:Uma2 family endonuclease [Lamprocystis sp. (in: g-proteobacteria)]